MKTIMDKRVDLNLKRINMMSIFKQLLFQDLVSKYNRFKRVFLESSRLESEIKSNLKKLKHG